MPTTKERINITVDHELYTTLVNIADKKHLALASYTKYLVETALELEEDRFFSAIADNRLSKDRSTVDHDDAWA